MAGSSTPGGFTGVIAPVLTPFDETGKADAKRFIEHARWLLAQGCTGLAPFGTTSEANSLSLFERLELLEALVESGIPADKLMPGTGACAIPDAVRLTRHAVDMGCPSVLMLPPFYYKAVEDEGLFRFFDSVIDQVGKPALKVYLYHIPPVAQVGFSHDLISRLLSAFPDTIRGLKDSSGNWGHTKSIIESFPELNVFSGSEVTLLDNLRAGGAGCISATANVNARGLRDLFDHSGDLDADDRQAKTTSLRLAIQELPVIAFLKAIIAEMRGDAGWRTVRPPLVAVDPSAARAAIQSLREIHEFAPRLG